MREQYAGRIQSSITRSGLKLVETTYGAEQAVAPHAHRHPLIVVLLNGRQTEHARGRTAHCEAGTALFHPPDEPHANDFGRRGAHCLIAELRNAWARRLDLASRSMPKGPVTGQGRLVADTGRLLRSEYQLGGAAHTGALDGLALTLLSALDRGAQWRRERNPHFLNRVLEKLHDDVASDTELATLAGLAGVSPEHLARTFHQRMRCTVGQYVRRLRVDKARRVLTDTDTPLSELAAALGFHDQAHFGRVFKHQVGCPPGEYRRRHRDAN